MYKVIINVYHEDKNFEAGQIYTKEQIGDLPESYYVEVEGSAPTKVVEVDEEAKTVTFDNGDTAPLVDREDVEKELGEDEVAKAEAEAINASSNDEENV